MRYHKTVKRKSSKIICVCVSIYNETWALHVCLFKLSKCSKVFASMCMAYVVLCLNSWQVTGRHCNSVAGRRVDVVTSVPERMCNTDVIFRPGHYVRQKESQMPVYPGALSPPAPPKQEVELCESSGRVAVRKRGRVLLEQSCSPQPQLLPRCHRHRLPLRCWGGFRGPTTWFELGEAALPVGVSPESAVCPIQDGGMGQWFGPHASPPWPGDLWRMMQPVARLPSWLCHPHLLDSRNHLGCFISNMNSQTLLEILIE